MRIIIGGPTYQRDWILTDWFAAIEKQTFPLSDIGFVFELGPNDDKTHEALFSWHANHPEVFCFDVEIERNQSHITHKENERVWTHNRYKMMAQLRNSVLERVTCINPDRFFSLDSDILLEDPNTISRLVELTETRDAVSTLAYMKPTDTCYPNLMSWVSSPGGNARRIYSNYSLGEVFQSDIIMASKMMTRQVFQNVRYRFHRKGEDLGWSYECHKQGYKLYCASDLYTPHIMHKWMLPWYYMFGDIRKHMDLEKVI